MTELKVNLLVISINVNVFNSLFKKIIQGKYKMSLEHLVVLKSKEMLKKNGGACQRHMGVNLKELPKAKYGKI